MYLQDGNSSDRLKKKTRMYVVQQYLLKLDFGYTSTH